MSLIYNMGLFYNVKQILDWMRVQQSLGGSKGEFANNKFCKQYPITTKINDQINSSPQLVSLPFNITNNNTILKYPNNISFRLLSTIMGFILNYSSLTQPIISLNLLSHYHTITLQHYLIISLSQIIQILQNLRLYLLLIVSNIITYRIIKGCLIIISMSAINPQEFKQILIQQQISESLIDQCSSIFTLIVALTNSRELLITGNNLSILLRYIKEGTESSLIQEAVSILHDLDDKGLPMDMKYFPLSIIRKLKIKILHNQSDIQQFHQKVRLLLSKQLYYEIDIIQKWDQLFFQPNRPEIEYAIKNIHFTEFKQSLQMKDEFGYTQLNLANRVMALISLPSFENDRTILQMFPTVLNSNVSMRIIQNLSQRIDIIPDTILQSLKAVSYIYTAKRYPKLQSFFKEGFTLMNVQFWELLINCVSIQDLPIKKQALVALSILCNYTPRFAYFLYNFRFDLLSKLCQLFSKFEDGNATFEALIFLQIWIKQFKKIMIQTNMEETKGALSSMLTYAIGFLGKNVPVYQKVAAIKVIQEVLVTMNIGQNQLLHLCKLPTLFVNGDPMLIGALLQLIYGIVRIESSISCQIFFSSVQFRFYIVSNLEDPRPVSHFICLTILLQMASHQNTQKFLFDKTILKALSKHVQFCTASTGKILSKLLRRMVEDSINQEFKLFLLYQCKILNILLQLSTKFYLSNKALDAYFEIPNSLIQDMELFVNCLVSFYCLFSYDMQVLESTNLRKIQKFKQQMTEQLINKLKEVFQIFYYKSNSFLVQKALRNETTINKTQPFQCRFVKMIGMMTEEMLLFFHATPLSIHIRQLRLSLYSGIYKNLTMLQIQDNNIPIIVTVAIECQNEAVTSFRFIKTSYQTFRKAVLTKVQPFFGFDINNLEVKEIDTNKIINSQTQYQKAVNDVVSKANIKPEIVLRIKISNIQAQNLKHSSNIVSIPQTFINRIPNGSLPPNFGYHNNFTKNDTMRSHPTYSQPLYQQMPQPMNNILPDIGMTNSINYRSMAPSFNPTPNFRTNIQNPNMNASVNTRMRSTTPQPRVNGLKPMNMSLCPKCRTVSPEGICRYCV